MITNGRLSAEHGISPPAYAHVAADLNGGIGPSGEAELLDDAMIEELRTALPPEMRVALLDTFDQQLAESLDQLTEAARRGDEIEVRRVAHYLKGSSASLGAQRLSVRCEGFELGLLDPDDGELEDLRRVSGEAMEALREQLSA